jgi:hemoglobin-like flavoprotein
MQLTDQEKELISMSFMKVAMNQEKVTQLFYGCLFETAPETRPLFKNADMREQGRKLMQTLATVVGSLHRLDALADDLHALGRRHIAYGVSQEQYELVGNVLFYTLETALAEDFTPETKAAWVKVYTLLTESITRAYAG